MLYTHCCLHCTTRFHTHLPSAYMDARTTRLHGLRHLRCTFTGRFILDSYRCYAASFTCCLHGFLLPLPTPVLYTALPAATTARYCPFTHTHCWTHFTRYAVGTSFPALHLLVLFTYCTSYVHARHTRTNTRWFARHTRLTQLHFAAVFLTPARCLRLLVARVPFGYVHRFALVYHYVVAVTRTPRRWLRDGTHTVLRTARGFAFCVISFSLRCYSFTTCLVGRSWFYAPARHLDTVCHSTFHAYRAFCTSVTTPTLPALFTVLHFFRTHGYTLHTHAVALPHVHSGSHLCILRTALHTATLPGAFAPLRLRDRTSAVGSVARRLAILLPRVDTVSLVTPHLHIHFHAWFSHHLRRSLYAVRFTAVACWFAAWDLTFAAITTPGSGSPCTRILSSHCISHAHHHTRTHTLSYHSLDFFLPHARAYLRGLCLSHTSLHSSPGPILHLFCTHAIPHIPPV